GQVTRLARVGRLYGPGRGLRHHQHRRGRIELVHRRVDTRGRTQSEHKGRQRDIPPPGHHDDRLPEVHTALLIAPPTAPRYDIPVARGDERDATPPPADEPNTPATHFAQI